MPLGSPGLRTGPVLEEVGWGLSGTYWLGNRKSGSEVLKGRGMAENSVQMAAGPERTGREAAPGLGAH